MTKNLTREQRAGINRANSLKSTGPKSPEGKQRSSINAIRHGLTGQVILMTEEEFKAYTVFANSFHNHFGPQGPVEIQYVQFMADSAWKLNRCRAHQDQILCILASQSPVQNSDAETDAVLAMAAAVAQCTGDLSRFSIYEQRQHRIFERSHESLVKIQETRKQREKDALDEAERLFILHQYEEGYKSIEAEREYRKAEASGTEPGAPPTPEHYHPHEDGFVYSIAEIKQHIDRKRRISRYFSIPNAAGVAA